MGHHKQTETQKQINCYQWYTETKQLLLPRDKPSNVYPKLCQSITNAECLSKLAHFTTTKVGTEGGFYKRKRAFRRKWLAYEDRNEKSRILDTNTHTHWETYKISKKWLKMIEKLKTRGEKWIKWWPIKKEPKCDYPNSTWRVYKRSNHPIRVENLKS